MSVDSCLQKHYSSNDNRTHDEDMMTRTTFIMMIMVIIGLDTEHHARNPALIPSILIQEHLFG